MKSGFWHVALCLLVMVVLQGGCRTTPPSRFFILPLLREESAVLTRSMNDAEFSVGVERVTVPEYLSRPQIVTQQDNGELNIAEFHRWGGSLEDNIVLVLAADLTRELESAYVDPYPWPARADFDYRVSVEILSLSGAPGGKAKLVAQWSVGAGAAAEFLVRRVSTYGGQVAGEGYAALVHAFRGLLSELAADVAGAIAQSRAPAAD